MGACGLFEDEPAAALAKEKRAELGTGDPEFKFLEQSREVTLSLSMGAPGLTDCT